MKGVYLLAFQRRFSNKQEVRSCPHRASLEMSAQGESWRPGKGFGVEGFKDTLPTSTNRPEGNHGVKSRWSKGRTWLGMVDLGRQTGPIRWIPGLPELAQSSLAQMSSKVGVPRNQILGFGSSPSNPE